MPLSSVKIVSLKFKRCPVCGPIVVERLHDTERSKLEIVDSCVNLKIIITLY